MRAIARRSLCLLLAGSLALPLPGQTAPEPQPPAEAPPQPPAATPPEGALPATGEPVRPPLEVGQELPATTAEPVAPPGAPVPAPPAPDRISFDLTFPAEEGGGSASGTAGSLEYERDNYAVLEGGVKIRYQDVELEAQRAEIDLLTKIVTATGDVIIDQGPRRISGASATFDLDTKTGTLKEATAHVAPDYYFTGAEVSKIDDDVYTVTDGIFTSCSGENPNWSFRLGKATVELEGYARVSNATMRVKKLPVFYTPYILWPAKTERTSGLLIPNIGYSERRGASLGLAYYQVLGRSFDTTVHVDTYTQGYLGLGNELRYAPTEGTEGIFEGYLIQDPDLDDWRWKVNWNHTTTDLPWGMRGVVAYENFSDFEYFRDFERDFDRNTASIVDSRAFISGAWGPHLVNFLVNERERFVSPGVTTEQRKLPELEYRLRSTRLGKTPLYLGFRGSLDYLDVDGVGDFTSTYGRADVSPELRLPLSTLPWLSLTLIGGNRFTWYGDSLAEDNRQAFTGESLTRNVPFGSAEIIGPSISRIFQRDVLGFGRFRHVIAPRFTYTYFDEVEDARRIPRFDEVDNVFSTNQGRVALSNRLLAKPKVEEGEEGAGGGGDSAREIVLFEIAREYSFDSLQPLQTSLDGLETDTAGPIEALLRFTPGQRTNFEARLDYSTLDSRFASSSLSGRYGFGPNFIDLTLYRRPLPREPEKIGNQLQVGGSVGIVPQRLRLEARLSYDVDAQEIQQQRYILNYASQCYGVRLEALDLGVTGFDDRRGTEFRFSLTLKNVGTFLDLTGRSDPGE